MTVATLRVLGLALAVFCAALSWLCYGLLTAPVSVGQIPSGASWTPGFGTPEFAADFAAEPDTDPVILARLVFSPIRRPPQPRPPEPEPVSAEPQQAPPEPAPEPVLPEGIVLQGVFIDGERQEALIASPTNPDGTWLKLGGTIEGWTIRRIQTGKIALDNGGREVALTLYVDNLGK